MFIQNLIIALIAAVFAAMHTNVAEIGLFMLVMIVFLNMICLPTKLILKLIF